MEEQIQKQIPHWNEKAAEGWIAMSRLDVTRYFRVTAERIHRAHP